MGVLAVVGTGTLHQLVTPGLLDDGFEDDGHNSRIHEEEAARTCGAVGKRMHDDAGRVEELGACHA